MVIGGWKIDSERDAPATSNPGSEIQNPLTRLRAMSCGGLEWRGGVGGDVC